MEYRAAGWSHNIPQGIFRSALLHVYLDVYISDAFVKTSVTDDTLTYEVSITNTGTASQDVTLSGSLSSWNCDTFAYPSIPDTTVTAAPGEERNYPLRGDRRIVQLAVRDESSARGAPTIDRAPSDIPARSC